MEEHHTSFFHYEDYTEEEALRFNKFKQNNKKVLASLGQELNPKTNYTYNGGDFVKSGVFEMNISRVPALLTMR